MGNDCSSGSMMKERHVHTHFNNDALDPGSLRDLVHDLASNHCKQYAGKSPDITPRNVPPPGDFSFSECTSN
jgi:hypothetical protein